MAAPRTSFGEIVSMKMSGSYCHPLSLKQNGRTLKRCALDEARRHYDILLLDGNASRTNNITEQLS